MIKKILAAMAAAVIGTATSLSAGAPAQAALSDCLSYSDVFCLWKYSQAQGSIWRQKIWQVPTTNCRPLTEPGWNDNVNSFRNNSPGTVLRLYSNGSCTGTWLEAYYGYTYDVTGTPWSGVISGINWRLE